MKHADPLLFPAGIASGEVFCNRVKERDALLKSILHHEHTLVISPRRYGKTSLILQVLQENKIPCAALDLLPAMNKSYVNQLILKGVSDILNQILPKQTSIRQKVFRFFGNMNPRVTFSALGQSLELQSNQSPEKSVTDALLNLDQVAQDLKVRVVMLLDEFQQISSLNDHHILEASIRHVVERSKNVTYLFSGSDRHILEQMFNDRSRPLYKLCSIMKIDRIPASEFGPFIQTAAVKKWKRKISQDALMEIINTTACHTYYVNYLCRQLWKLETSPTPEQVRESWLEYVDLQLPWIRDDVAKLSANQRAIMMALTLNPATEPQGKTFVRQTGLVPASIKRAMDGLIRDNMVYEDIHGVYRVLDPAIETYFRSVIL